ncbi:unnamed protein product [Rhizoctonia solani]|uniref:CHAT domain-containing protein n=1 Tax=Rhizoctonia solani TaxID=456999 RepID=A0A8H2WUT6_9AGAM|nr:unnamed protein product [Rhizoctonia solani]
MDELGDLEQAMEYDSRAIGLTPSNHPHLPSALANLGTSHHYRFKRLSKLADLEKAIEYQFRAVKLAPDGHPEMSIWLTNLGTSHSDRFQRLGELADLERSIQYRSQAVDLTPNDHPDLSSWLGNLGTSHTHRYKRLGELADLEKAIEYQDRALDLTPDGHPDFSSRLANLGISHGDRFQRLGELVDIEKAIQYESCALKLTSDGHPSLSNRLSNLGVSHTHRFQRLGELADLENAIEYQSRAVDSTPDDHPHLSIWLANLGTSHSDRFQRLGELADLEKAIQCESRALELTADGHPDLSSRLANIGTSHSDRFQRLGELMDLEKAIQYQSRAVNLTPDGHPNILSWLTNLGTSYNHRFQCLGELADLEKAIQHQSRAVDLTPDPHPDLSYRIANLGSSHSDRFQRLGKLVDLERAIQHQSHALNLTPDGHPDLPSRLANLGTSYNYRFQHLGELPDLEKAIQHQSRAVHLTPDVHPDLPRWLINLGMSYMKRYQHVGELSDLQKAIHCQSLAVASTPDNHPRLALMHLHSAQSSFFYYQCTNNRSHLGHSLHSFRLATRLTAGAPRDRFRHGLRWATLASKHSDLNPIEAYQTAIDLLPQYVWLGATTHQRYEDLLTTKTLAVDAAYAAILSLNYALALEWLEHTRCVVWTQSMMLRSPLDQLQSAHPALSTELQVVAEQLHRASSDSRESLALASGSMTAEQVAEDHRSLAQKYNDLLSQIRTLPGFEDFLCPMKVNSLVRAARYGAVVVINCHQDRCDALIGLPEQGTVDHLPLPHFTAEKAQRTRSKIEISVEDMRLRERAVERRPLVVTDKTTGFGSALAELWNYIVKPVLDFLGYTKNVSLSSSLPAITWCPTGALSFLPLHAAGDYDEPRSRVFDYVVSSYTPTLTALLETTPSYLNRNSGVLAIGQVATPGHSSLPGTAMELALVKAHTEHKAKYSQLMDNQATISAVLKAMEENDWIHLACHAHQNVGNATESGFFLHDGTLDLAAINRRSFKNKGLAFLSACQTAKGDKTLPDEAIHLASGMLMAGYTSVIATMWSVVDEDAPIVADKVYADLMKDGKLGNGEAGRALHNAVAVLRNRVGVEAFERWVPYIHIGS